MIDPPYVCSTVEYADVESSKFKGWLNNKFGASLGYIHAVSRNKIGPERQLRG